MEISRADGIVTAAEWSDRVEILSPSAIWVAAVDPLPNVTPEMLDWWFAHMERDTYLDFHPVDHEDFAWVRGKRPGAYVGATHFTQQRYGGEEPVMRAEISFVEPSELFDTGLFEQHGVGTVICAVVHMVSEDGTPASEPAARFAHVAVRRDYGTELRSAWWLNAGPGADVDWLTNRRLRHVHEEFAYLAGFLPGLYARSSDPAHTA